MIPNFFYENGKRNEMESNFFYEKWHQEKWNGIQQQSKPLRRAVAEKQK